MPNTDLRYINDLHCILIFNKFELFCSKIKSFDKKINKTMNK